MGNGLRNRILLDQPQMQRQGSPVWGTAQSSLPMGVRMRNGGRAEGAMQD